MKALVRVAVVTIDVVLISEGDSNSLYFAYILFDLARIEIIFVSAYTANEIIYFAARHCVGYFDFC